MRRLALAIGIAMVCTSWGSQIISRPPHSGAMFTNYSAESFRQLREVQQPIDPERINYRLLDASVFHATNRRRAQHRLPPLTYSRKAEEMARIQAQAMAKGEFVEHENPNPGQRTMADRAKLVGLRPRVLAENVASAFGRRYQSGKPFYTRQERGRTVYSYKPDGTEIPMHTYLSFGEALVESWMQSPGHRKNILHNEPEYLACACELPRNVNAMETFYCVQVFFSPLTEEIKPPPRR